MRFMGTHKSLLALKGVCRIFAIHVIGEGFFSLIQTVPMIKLRTGNQWKIQSSMLNEIESPFISHLALLPSCVAHLIAAGIELFST